MGCITDAMRITNVLNHVAYWNYLRLSFITCPISPLSLARFHPSSEVMSCEQFPTTLCNVHGQLGLFKGTIMRHLYKRNKGTLTTSNQAKNLWGDAKWAVPPNYRTPAAFKSGRSPKNIQTETASIQAWTYMNIHDTLCICDTTYCILFLLSILSVLLDSFRFFRFL